MATGQRSDPFRNYRFRIEVNGILTAAFSEATVPDSTTDMKEYREGTDPTYTRKLSGLTKYGNLTLKKGTTDSLELYNWRKLVEEKGADKARKNVSLILVDDEGQDKARWDIFNAWPTRYENTGFNASSEDVMIESLELVLERMVRSF